MDRRGSSSDEKDQCGSKFICGEMANNHGPTPCVPAGEIADSIDPAIISSSYQPFAVLEQARSRSGSRLVSGCPSDLTRRGRRSFRFHEAATFNMAANC